MTIISTLLTTFWTSLFAGAALYISLVEHPARMECGTELAVTESRPSYRRAAVMQALLAVLTLLFSVFAWLTSGNAWWLMGGLVMGSVVPLTLIVIMPTNKALLDVSLDKQSPKAQQLLRTWGRLHALRTGLSLLSLLLFLLLLVVHL